MRWRDDEWVSNISQAPKRLGKRNVFASFLRTTKLNRILDSMSGYVVDNIYMIYEEITEQKRKKMKNYSPIKRHLIAHKLCICFKTSVLSWERCDQKPRFLA